MCEVLEEFGKKEFLLHRGKADASIDMKVAEFGHKISRYLRFKYGGVRHGVSPNLMVRAICSRQAVA